MLRRAFFLILLLSPILSTASEKPWTEVRSQHFRVVTNGSTRDTIKVAQEFEQMRWVFATRFPNIRLDSGAPLLVFAARDGDTAKELDPLTWKRMGEHLAGAFYHGWEKEYAMVRLDTFGGIIGVQDRIRLAKPLAHGPPEHGGQIGPGSRRCRPSPLD